MSSNVSKRTIYQIETKLTELARRRRYEEGLVLIDDFLNKYGIVDEILVQKAFFLYHYAAYLKYNHTQNSNGEKMIKQNFKQAVDICKLLIKKLRSIDNRNLLNVRIYLAQI